MDLPVLSLPGFTYKDLYDPHRLAELAETFYQGVKTADSRLFQRFETYRQTGGKDTPEPMISDLLVRMALHLSRFLARLFQVTPDAEILRLTTGREQIIFQCKKVFFIRRVLKKYPPALTDSINLEFTGQLAGTILRALPSIPHDDPELEAASGIMALLEHERYAKAGLPPASCDFLAALAARLRTEDPAVGLLPAASDEPSLRMFLLAITTVFEQWLAALYARGARSWAMFQLPHPVDYMHLVDMESPDSALPLLHVGRPEHYRRREGFELTDARFGPRRVLSEVDYCILCHERDKDSCSKGLREGGAFRKNPLGYVLKGCPLGQRVSESHALKAMGDSLGALAMIMIDNPMVPGHGPPDLQRLHEVVHLPEAGSGEHSADRDAASSPTFCTLPCGFEIYSLLTRWNPLNITPPVSAALQRQERAGRRHGAGGLHAGAPSAERGLRRRRHRRAEDRAASPAN